MISLITLRSIVPELLYKQLIAFLLSFALFFIAAQFPFWWYLRIGKWIYFLLNLVLLGLLFYGKVTRGITAWITLPLVDFRFQPSQFAMPITALVLASQSQLMKDVSWWQLAKLFAIILVPTTLILLEPDFGTAFVLFISLAVFVFFQNISWQKVAILTALAGFVALGTWFFVLKPYQKDRIFSFLGGTSTITNQLPHEESSSSYNSRQALIAIGSGQLWGRGVGQGVQSHLRFLPERQTDFIFASFSEEWGFVGAIIILGLYFILLAFLLRLGTQLPNFSARLFVLSAITMFLLQIFINIGMNLAVLPITGITLPFLSYGGSSLLAFFFVMGILQSLLRERRRQAVLTFY